MATNVCIGSVESQPALPADLSVNRLPVNSHAFLDRIGAR
jgi:hypothetical protein